MVMLLITVHQGETDEHKVKILTNNRTLFLARTDFQLVNVLADWYNLY